LPSVAILEPHRSLSAASTHIARLRAAQRLHAHAQSYFFCKNAFVSFLKEWTLPFQGDDQAGRYVYQDFLARLWAFRFDPQKLFCANNRLSGFK